MTELLYLSERDWIIKKKWEDDAKHKKVDRLVKDLLVIMGRTRDELGVWAKEYENCSGPITWDVKGETQDCRRGPKTFQLQSRISNISCRDASLLIVAEGRSIADGLRMVIICRYVYMFGKFRSLK